MPGTHLLPPNLLKLFAPRAPLPYARPVDRDIDRVSKKGVSGVAEILARLREASTEGLINGTAEAEGMEEGEEPNYTYAEETKRQIRREERRKKRADTFRVAKDTCACFSFLLVAISVFTGLFCLYADKPADDPEAVGDPYKTLFIARLVSVKLKMIFSPLSLTEVMPLPSDSLSLEQKCYRIRR
jgi:U1 small nuclear ribonucleoprotein 70kDa